MILPKTSISLMIPIREIAEMANAGHTEKLDIFSSKGKPMLLGKVTDLDGRPALVISSPGGDIPRVYIKPRGRGLAEPFDVLWPRGDVYGTLAPSRSSCATLSHRDQPIMNIYKLAELPLLDMS